MTTSNLPVLADLGDDLSPDQHTALMTLIDQFSPATGGATGGPDGLDIADDGMTALTLPTLKVKQRMTTDPGCPTDAKEGDMYTTTGDILDPETKFVPVAIWTEHIKWEPGGGSNIECKSPGKNPAGGGMSGNTYGSCSECPDLPWRDGKKQDCDRTLVGVILTEDIRLLMVRFSSTSYPAGSTLVRFVRALPSMWAKMFQLGTDKRKNTKGEFFVFETRATTEVPNDDLQRVAAHFCSQVKEARNEFLATYYTSLDEPGSKPEGEGETIITTVSVGADAEEPGYDTEL